jgi:hypothetical protein
MRKLAALLILMITIGMVFVGAVSAQEVETAVINEDGSPVDVTCPGDEVAVQVNASADDETIPEPWVAITVDPDTGLEFEVDDAVMFLNGEIFENIDPIFGGFFFWYEDGQVWAWNIGWVTEFGEMNPGDEAQLIAPAIVTDTGLITVDADFLELYPFQQQEPILLDSDSYTFLSLPCTPQVTGETVPMQATGSPLAAAALGFLSIIGGAVYGKLR